MKAKYWAYTHEDGKIGQEQYHFFCPGCRHIHAVGKNIHTFNGDFEKPTFTPSVLVTWGGQPNWCCHSFVTNGMIQFLGDCTHELKNQTVALPDLTDEMK